MLNLLGFCPAHYRCQELTYLHHKFLHLRQSVMSPHSWWAEIQAEMWFIGQQQERVWWGTSCSLEVAVSLPWQWPAPMKKTSLSHLISKCQSHDRLEHVSPLWHLCWTPCSPWHQGSVSQVSPWLPLLSASPAPGVCGICCFRLNVQQKSHPSEGVYLGWIPWLSTPASVPVCLLPLYVLTVMGNLCIIVFVSTHHQLHRPMYYFLCNFAFLGIWFTTACIPKTLANLVSQSQSISFNRLPPSDVLCFLVWLYRIFLPCSHGIWSLLGCVLPPELQRHHDQHSAQGAGSGLLGGWFPGHFSASIFNFQVVFLWL